MVNLRYFQKATINGSPVTMVKWMPGSENLFMASYQDGCVIIFDKEKDDQNFTPSPLPNTNLGGSDHHVGTEYDG